MAVLRHVGCGLCFRTAAVLTLVSIALAVVMILYTDMRLRSRLDDIANTNTKPENQLEAETNVQTLVERMQARLDMLDEKARGVGREAGDTLYYDRCDLHATRDRAPPLIVMATTMGNSSADMKRKIRQNALRGFMAQTPPTAVRPMVFTDSAQVIAEVRAEMAKLDAAETTVLDFEQEHGWPTFAGMMKRAEAKAIELDAPFCKSGCKLPHFVLLLRLCRPTSQGAPLLTVHWHADGYANGDILFVRPLQIHFTLGCDHKASRSQGQKPCLRMQTEDLVVTLRLVREAMKSGFFIAGETSQVRPNLLYPPFSIRMFSFPPGARNGQRTASSGMRREDGPGAN